MPMPAGACCVCCAWRHTTRGCPARRSACPAYCSARWPAYARVGCLARGAGPLAGWLALLLQVVGYARLYRFSQAEYDELSARLQQVGHAPCGAAKNCCGIESPSLQALRCLLGRLYCRRCLCCWHQKVLFTQALPSIHPTRPPSLTPFRLPCVRVQLERLMKQHDASSADELVDIAQRQASWTAGAAAAAVCVGPRWLHCPAPAGRPACKPHTFL